jgi:hypothetical protein
VIKGAASLCGSVAGAADTRKALNSGNNRQILVLIEEVLIYAVNGDNADTKPAAKSLAEPVIADSAGRL